jgi:hypothetical protein
MKKAISFILFLLVCFAIVNGQDDKLKKIRQLYSDTNDKIAKSKLPGEEGWGNLYSTEVIVNSNNGSWRAVGNYANKIIFWYYDQPGFQEDENKSDLVVLVKIEIYTSAAAGKYNEEYLYDDGKLVFYYKNSNQPEMEVRYYFWNEKLFRFQENQEIIKEISQIDPSDIKDKSLKLQKLFLQTFN